MRVRRVIAGTGYYHTAFMTSQPPRLIRCAVCTALLAMSVVITSGASSGTRGPELGVRSPEPGAGVAGQGVAPRKRPGVRDPSVRIPMDRLKPDQVFDVPGAPDWIAIDEDVWI